MRVIIWQIIWLGAFAGVLMGATDADYPVREELATELAAIIHAEPTSEVAEKEIQPYILEQVKKSIQEVFPPDLVIDPQLLKLAIPTPVVTVAKPELLALICKRHVLITRWNYDFLKECPPLDEEQQKQIAEQIDQWAMGVKKSLVKRLASQIPLLTQEQIEKAVEDDVQIALKRRLVDPISYQCKVLIPQETLQSDIQQYDENLQERAGLAVQSVTDARDKEAAVARILSEAVTAAKKQFIIQSSDETRVKVATQLKQKIGQEYGGLIQKIRELEQQPVSSTQPGPSIRTINP